MINHFVGNQEACVLRASPLGPHLDALAAELVKDGYGRFTGQFRLRVLKDFGCWLEAGGHVVGDLDEELVAIYLEERRRGCRHGSRRCLRVFLEHLRRGDVIAKQVVVVGVSPDELLLGQYETYLQKERGLAAVTIEG